MIRQYNHAGFTVSSVEKSLEFYRKLLGFTLLSLADRPKEYSERVTGVRGCSLRIAYLRGYGLTLELVEYVGSSKRRARSKNDNIGAGHVCLEVDNLWSVVEELRRNKVEFRGDPISIPSGINQGGLTVYALDPDGVVIEFIQPPGIEAETHAADRVKNGGYRDGTIGPG